MIEIFCIGINIWVYAIAGIQNCSTAYTKLVGITLAKSRNYINPLLDAVLLSSVCVNYLN